MRSSQEETERLSRVQVVGGGKPMLNLSTSACAQTKWPLPPLSGPRCTTADLQSDSPSPGQDLLYAVLAVVLAWSSYNERRAL